ncbi:cupin domain-containing protein [Cohnella sp. CFH 77786]|uniref:cupin domain-containing protein n=1 Tax=Cohnella sp. CFH 77786 TaxID=2662265 RepID=UPI001C608D3B|nr:cupin domain-containing protein [Cohnella sp. CFH 77786]MBW5447331.1 cupin domain-containing protein [Cohnella sp. CFH 77786]
MSLAAELAVNRTIENPQVGDRVTFLTTRAESGGAYEWVEVELKAGGGNSLHYHTAFVEEFESMEGELYVDCDGKTFVLKPGERATAPIRTLHRFYNPGQTGIRFRVKIVPARHFEPTLRIAYGLACDGKTNKNGIPKNVLALAVIFQLGESYLAGMPIWLQKGIFGLLYRIAKWAGTEKRLLETYCHGT